MPNRLFNLGNSQETRFHCLDQLNDLEDAISNKLNAVQLTAEGHPNMPSRLSSLGNCQETRFQRLNKLTDLGNAISNK